MFYILIIFIPILNHCMGVLIINDIVDSKCLSFKGVAHLASILML
jgi:hypothetical protein